MAIDCSCYSRVSAWHSLRNVRGDRCILSTTLEIFPILNLVQFFIRSAQAVQNLGLAVVSILAGIIVDRGGYFMLEMFFLGWLWGTFSFFL